ncbi:MAG: undecaprenyl diphosphate synthase family protein [Caulobacteraceae bacterium]
MRRTVEAAPDLGVTTLTLFAFACANWQRPAGEIDALMALFRSYLAEDAPRLIEGGARLTMIGRRDRLPATSPWRYARSKPRPRQGTALTSG